MQPIRVVPLTTTIGARIEGVDLREPLSAEAGDMIRAALAANFVLVFENQPIGLEQQKKGLREQGAEEL